METIWPYQIVSLTQEEIAQRRDLLDLRGSIAQWSTLVAIVAIRFYQNWETAAAQANGAPRGPTSWWDQPVIAGWLESRRQYTVCGLWLFWLLSLSVWNSGDDYLHLTKALGHVALTQVPFQVLMSPAAYISKFKPGAASIFSFLTSVPQSTVTSYHRLFGRIVVLPLLFGHATLYLLFFVRTSHPEFGILLAKRVRDVDVQCGISVLCSAIALLLFTRPRGVGSKGVARTAGGSIQERRQSFYWGHVSLVVFMCVSAFYHVVHARKYMLQALGASVLNGVCSWAMIRWGGKVSK